MPKLTYSYTRHGNAVGLQTQQVTAAATLLAVVIFRPLYANSDFFFPFHFACRKETSKTCHCTINCCPVRDLKSMKAVALFICLLVSAFAIPVSPHRAVVTVQLKFAFL